MEQRTAKVLTSHIEPHKLQEENLNDLGNLTSICKGYEKFSAPRPSNLTPSFIFFPTIPASCRGTIWQFSVQTDHFHRSFRGKTMSAEKIQRTMEFNLMIFFYTFNVFMVISCEVSMRPSSTSSEIVFRLTSCNKAREVKYLHQPQFQNVKQGSNFK